MINFYGCSTTIYEVKSNPSKFEGDEVQLIGTVAQVYETEIESNNSYSNIIYIYKLEDEGEYVYVLTDSYVTKGTYRKIKGKLVYLKNKKDREQVQLFYRYLYAYLSEKGYLKSNSKKSENFFIWHIFKFLINIFTDSKFESTLDDFDDAVLYSIENQPDKNEVIEDAMNKILYRLPDGKRIVIVFEQNYEVY